ncbi:MAG TPA: hypothetical protein VEB00_14780 [Clostridia bacterium]|nr:hypothetical protein [Clostridia bacterium]
MLENLMKEFLRILPRFYENSGLDLFSSTKEYILKVFSRDIQNHRSLDEIEHDFYNLIICKVQYFRYDELIFIVEFMREQYCQKLHPKEHLFRMNEFNEIALHLQKICLQLGNQGFQNNAVLYENTNLDELFELIKLYNIFILNMEYYKALGREISDINLFEPIKDEKVDQFFDECAELYTSRKIEQEEIIDPRLRQYLVRKRLMPELIMKRANHSIETILGFRVSDLDIIVNNLHLLDRDSKIKDHYYVSKDRFKKLFKKYLDVQTICNIIEYFSIIRLFKAEIEVSTRHLELRCFYEEGKCIKFGKYTFIEVVTIFKNICFSGHFMGEMIIDKKNKSLFSELQQDMSLFFSYKLADFIESQGFILPRDPDEPDIVYVDIKKIINKKGKTIAFNDIDILAYKPAKKLIYNFELKYYKAAMSHRELVFDKIENKVYQQIALREKLIAENLCDILDILFGIIDWKDVKVKSVIITARPSFGGVTSENKNISCYSWNRLAKEVKAGIF